ncbi:cell cycle checkpoint protein RAD17-like [Diadema antillarum]|uniref:cell cycle checkpoint protein RAD17-like n=1 Tax=Diadema antillarum TaxID=105358 RepID=UPI003A8B33C4
MHQWITSSFDGLVDESTTKTTSNSRGKTGKTWTNQGAAGRKRPRKEEEKLSQSWSQWKKHLEGQTWADRHCPHTLADLAVHKKKIQEVEDWLCFHMKQNRQPVSRSQAPLLLLTGQAGVGKTATIRVLADKLGLELQEWSNPVSSAFQTDTPFDYKAESYVRTDSQVTQFQDFLKRANRYPALQLEDGELRTKKVVLVEDIPNAFYRDPSSLHAVLTRFSYTGRCPLVFIVSDSHGGKSNALSLFPADVQSNLRVHNISFNPIAPTMMTKTLTKVASAEASRARHKFCVPAKSTIEALAVASSGDIRAAINALQFASLKGIESTERRLTEKPCSNSALSSSSSHDSQWQERRMQLKGTEKEEKGPVAIGGKDTSLFLFRALGKIFYCKREPKTAKDPLLPPHLSHHDRDRLIVNPEELFERTHMSNENFILYLHQNYLDFYTDLDSVVEGSRHLSDTDFLTCEWTHRTTMRQYSASVAVRSLIHYNSSRRWCNKDGGGGGGHGWKPLHKPEWFAVSRKYQERCAVARSLFVGHSWTPHDLQTQLLPYLALTNTPLKNPGQISFLQEVTRFSNSVHERKWLQRLDERDLDDTSVEDDFSSSQPTVSSSQSTRHKLILSNQNTDALDDSATNEDSDDEVIIEDYDDD